MHCSNCGNKLEMGGVNMDNITCIDDGIINQEDYNKKKEKLLEK